VIVAILSAYGASGIGGIIKSGAKSRLPTSCGRYTADRADRPSAVFITTSGDKQMHSTHTHPNSTALQASLEQSVAKARAQFLIGMTADAAGVTFSGAAGEAAPGRPAAVDSVLRIFSMTKAVGSTAAMILVERGQLDLDAPVESILPDFARLQVLTGWNGDQPTFRAPRTKATVRQLATHTSGLEYEFWCAEMNEYLTRTGRPSILTGTRDALNYPLMTDPGTRWGYGISIDWLGLVVQKVSGQRIDAFVTENILQPLGMADTVFEPRPDMAPRLAKIKARGEDGKFANFEINPPPHPEVYGMGHALYSTARDYLHFLRLFLNEGAVDGVRILSKNSVRTMRQNQMEPLKFAPMVTAIPSVSADFDPFPGTVKTYTVGFLRNEADIPGRRRAGSLSWAGVLNSHYWIDPTSNVIGVIATQTLPFVEPPFMAAYEDFERAVYA
jgi:CubicO group peptidase (beta-lactamase class C family)